MYYQIVIKLMKQSIPDFFKVMFIIKIIEYKQKYFKVNPLFYFN